MGVELINLNNREKDFLCNWSGWEKLFGKAREFGWIPKGTKYEKDLDIEYLMYIDEIPESEKEKFIADQVELEQTWDGSYFVNGWQIVSEEDAANMRKALKAAIEAMEAVARKNTEGAIEAMERASLSSSNFVDETTREKWRNIALEWKSLAFVMKFILFLEDGDFQIR